MRDDELETTLVDIGRRLRYPAASAVASRVRARIARPRTLRERWSLPAFAPAFATTALLLIVIALASPGVRAAADQFLRLRGIEIFPVPSVPAATGTPTLALPGERVTLDEARRRVRFPLTVPSAPELGAPDDVYLESTATSDRVTLVYRVRPGIPVSKEAGVSALIVEFNGALDEILLGKAIGPGTTIESTVVGQGRAFWLQGAPHQFFYREQDGTVRPETLRLAGNTLLWQGDGRQSSVTFRLEADVSRAQALRIASSFR
jgi:hypothetical protein